MICPNCKKETTRLISDTYGMACATCRGLSENGGARVSGILTRNSDRIRAQQLTHEGDMITPHKFDKLTGKSVANPEFVAKYPEQLTNYFTEDELREQGYSKADKLFKDRDAKLAKHAQEASDVTYAKDPGNEKMKEVIKNA